MDPSLRKLPKSKNAAQTKILPFPNVVKFMKVAGFTFDGNDYIECKNYNPDVLNECSNAIADFIKQLGGNVESQRTFNPYQSTVGSTSGPPSLPGSTEANKEKFLNQRKEIEKIQK